MLSQKMLGTLNAGEFDLAVVRGMKADWNPKMEQFENMRGFIVNWGEEKASDLEDNDVQLYKELKEEKESHVPAGAGLCPHCGRLLFAADLHPPQDTDEVQDSGKDPA